jgi:hypothetical protein
MAEEVGFEPTVGCPTTVFKTVALDHSAIPPTIHQHVINFRHALIYKGNTLVYAARLIFQFRGPGHSYFY